MRGRRLLAILLLSSLRCLAATDPSVRFLEAVSGEMEAGVVVEVATEQGFAGTLEVSLLEVDHDPGAIAESLLDRTADRGFLVRRARASAAIELGPGAACTRRLALGRGTPGRAALFAWSLRGKDGALVLEGEERATPPSALLVLSTTEPGPLPGITSVWRTPERAPLLRGSYGLLSTVVASGGALGRVSDDAIAVLLHAVEGGYVRLVVVGPLPAARPELDRLAALETRRFWRGAGGAEIRGGSWGSGTIVVVLGEELEDPASLERLGSIVPLELVLAGVLWPRGVALPSPDGSSAVPPDPDALLRRLGGFVLLVLGGFWWISRAAPSFGATLAACIAFCTLPAVAHVVHVASAARDPWPGGVRVQRGKAPFVVSWRCSARSMTLPPGPWTVETSRRRPGHVVPSFPFVESVQGLDGRLSLRTRVPSGVADVRIAASRLEGGTLGFEADVAREGRRLVGEVRSERSMRELVLLDPWGESLDLGALDAGRAVSLESVAPPVASRRDRAASAIRAFAGVELRGPVLVGTEESGDLAILEIDAGVEESWVTVPAEAGGCAFTVPAALLAEIAPDRAPPGVLAGDGIRRVEVRGAPAPTHTRNGVLLARVPLEYLFP